jgi:LDH2 family malate/lactate/ureidoglycolate dehydrogenase
MTKMSSFQPRFDVEAVERFTLGVFLAAGLDPDKARAVSHYLVEADLMGHTTHGLALAPGYLQSIADGIMTKAGKPVIVSDRGACVAWDGQRLPGAWLTEAAMDLAIERAQQFGTAIVTVGNSHHIGCLAAYLTRATDRGNLVTLASSSPSGASVAPFGGRKGVFSPNPIAYGIPTSGAPILIDISASITTAHMSRRLVREGKRFPQAWLLNPDGSPTDDPRTLDQGGTILPAGGLDHGQKGYGMALFIEALTQGLAGFGRADQPMGTSAAVTIQVLDPDAFAGQSAFRLQMDWLANACLTNPPRPGVESVRLPGGNALARKQQALEDGLLLQEGVFDAFVEKASSLGFLTTQDRDIREDRLRKRVVE